MTNPTYQALNALFAERVGGINRPAIVRDVAFDLNGGLDGAARAFAGEVEADIYARPHNPTVRELTDTLNELEGGVGAVAYASGQAAIRNVLETLVGQGGEIVASRHLFGGTVSLVQSRFARQGITVRWADARDAGSFASQVNDNTRAFIVESVANPGSEVADLAGIADVAKWTRTPFIVDNTVSPLLARPFDHGADVVVYSATKYLSGHGDAIAGVAIDGGTFDWKGDKRFPVLSEGQGLYPSLAARFNERALTKALQQGLTVDGAVLGPDAASQVLRGMQTLPLRLAYHVENTKIVAEFLETNKGVERVDYAGLTFNTSQPNAQKYLPHGVAGPIMVTVKGGLEGARHVINDITGVFAHAVNLGDTRSLVSHPATTTHRQLTPENKAALGIADGSLRLSIGLEDAGRLVGTLGRALDTLPALKR